MSVDYEIYDLGDVKLQRGATLRGCKLAYKTFGTLNAAKDNVIVYPTWYSGQHYDNEWLVGAGRALDATELEQVARWATGDLRPHLTVVLDVEPSAGLARFEGRDRIEGESLEFHQRVRQAFLDLAAQDPDHYLVLDARASIDEIAAEIAARVEPLLARAVRR